MNEKCIKSDKNQLDVKQSRLLIAIMRSFPNKFLLCFINKTLVLIFIVFPKTFQCKVEKAI